MKKNIILFFIGLILGTLVSVSLAKYESGSGDAASVVAYGYYNNTLVPILVDSDGVLQVQ